MKRVWRRLLGAGQWRVAVALVLLLIAAVMPEVKLPHSTYNYVVTFDITQSMNVVDVSYDGEPVSRLVQARSAMRDALHSLPCGSKVGWAFFGDYRSFTLLQPIEVCSNYDVLLSALDKIDGRMRWANASNISKGVYWARHNAHEVADTNILFLTDGQEAPPIREGLANMPVLDPPPVGGYLIGVGGEVPSRIPKTNDEGVESGYWTADAVAQDPNLPTGTSHEHLSELREAYLEKLAARSGLAYRRLEDKMTLIEALHDKRWAHTTSAPSNLRWLPGMLALLLLVWRYFPGKTPTIGL